jgi:hypothetical protein
MIHKSETTSPTASFLQQLFSGKPDKLYILVWGLPEKQSRWFRSVEDAIRYVKTRNDRDTYIGAGLSIRDCGLNRRCESDEIAGVVALWADFDVRSPAHPKETLPSTVEQALLLIPPELQPSFTIASGNGLQCWWIFREPWIFEDGHEREKAAAFVRRWTTFLRDKASLRGWKFDRLYDLARVLRVPGTKNCKDPSNPKDVRILAQADRRYDPSEIEKYLDSAGFADADAEDHAAQRSAELFKEQPITINLGARIPEETLNRWLGSDQRFKNTWFRQRGDLNDQSQSGYDMALACYGIRAGLSWQQITDLIVHHRAIHNERQRTRVEYFQRTIAKAADRDRPMNVFAADGQLPGTIPTTSDAKNAPDKKPSSDMERVELCRRISRVLGVEVLRIVKIDGKEPLYRMDLAEGKVEFDGVAKLISQTAVRVSIAARVGKIIANFKPREWQAISQMMLDACEVEHGGEELDYEGAARLHLSRYLGEAAPIESLEGQLYQNLRKPMVRDGRITVCSDDLQMHIVKTTMQNVSIKAVVGMLSAIGAKVMRVRGKRIREQTRWELPIDDFKPSDFWPAEA